MSSSAPARASIVYLLVRAFQLAATCVAAALLWAVPAHAAELHVGGLPPAPLTADLSGDVVAERPGGAARAAYRLGGGRWAKGKIPYFLAARQHRWSVKKAVGAWNRSGARVRFKAVSRKRAKLVIDYYPRKSQPRPTINCWSGHATLGYVPGASRVWLPRLGPRSRYADYNCALIAVHELGHVLGLGHEERRCATMNPSSVNLSPRRCTPNREWEWRCRMLERDDVRGAVRRYGGRVRKPRTPAMCAFYDPAPPPSDVTAAPVSEGALLSWTRALDSPVPPWLLAARSIGGFRRIPSYSIAAYRDTCPVAPEDQKLAYSVEPGEPETVYVPLVDPGRYCIALQAFDELGRPSAGQATVWFDHPTAPPPDAG